MMVKFRRGSVFIRTFLILSLLSLIVVTTFYTYANSLYAERLRENMRTTNQNLLVQAGNTVDLQLGQVVATTSHFMRNMDVIESTTAPNTSNYPRNRSVVEQIAALLHGDNIIRNFYYYIPYNQRIYASKDSVVNYIPFSEFDHPELVEGYLEHSQGWEPFPYRSITAYIHMTGDSLYIYQPFPVRAKLFGLAVIELDMTELAAALADSTDSTQHSLYVYDRDGAPIFDSRWNYPDIAPRDVESAGGILERQGTLYYSYRAGNTGWVYLYGVPAGLQMHSNLNVVSILPFLLFFLVVSLLFSLYITRSIYKPIGNLMTAITTAGEGSPGWEKRVNEFDYLQMAYSDVSQRAQSLSGLLDNVTPAILETMFLNILYQRCPGGNYIEQTLESIGSPLSISGPYAVLLVELLPAGGVGPTEMERQLYTISVKKAIQASLPEHFRSFCFDDREDRVVSVLCLNGALSPSELRGDVARIYAEAGRRIGQLPFEAALGGGSVCSGLSELHFSYLEAQQALKSGIYYGSGGDDESALSERQREEYLGQRAGHLNKLAAEGSREEAEEFAMRCTRQIVQETGDDDAACRDLLRFADLVLEGMKVLHVDSDALSALEERAREISQRYMGKPDKLQQHTTLLCSQAVALLEQNSGKQSFRYIRAARDFILDNYASSGLSLNAVSEHIGISPAYLSKLMGEHLQQGFNSYLNWVRVEKAKELLHKTDISVAALGLDTGFNSTQSFIRVFKRYTGMTPGQFRERGVAPEADEGDSAAN